MARFLTTLDVRPMADGQNWTLLRPLLYQSDVLLQHSEDGSVDVPQQFITDFASIPDMLRVELPVWNTYGPAAVLHDWLYWEQPVDRDIADAVLREACHVLAVPEMVTRTLYLGVRMGGQQPWDRNTQLRASGYTRMSGATTTPPYAGI